MVGGNQFWGGLAVGAGVVVVLAVAPRVLPGLTRACVEIYREALAELEAEGAGDVVGDVVAAAESVAEVEL